VSEDDVITNKRRHRDHLAMTGHIGTEVGTKAPLFKKQTEFIPLLDRPCRKCGAPLHFARTHKGDTIPLDLRAHVWVIVYDRTEPRRPSTVVRTELAYVSHFFTCPYASEFSRKNKESDSPEGDAA
jgi:hypothetical protein